MQAVLTLHSTMLNETCACQNCVLTLQDFLSIFCLYRVFVFLSSTYFLISDVTASLTHGLLRNFVLNFQISGHFSQYLFSLILFVVREYTSSLFKGIKTCFMVQNMILVKSSICNCKECVFCCGWVKCSMHVTINLTYSVIQVFYIFTDFLITCSITEKGELQSPAIFVDFSLPLFNFFSFCFMDFEAVVIYIQDCYVLVSAV